MTDLESSERLWDFRDSFGAQSARRQIATSSVSWKTFGDRGDPSENEFHSRRRSPSPFFPTAFRISRTRWTGHGGKRPMCVGDRIREELRDRDDPTGIGAADRHDLVAGCAARLLPSALRRGRSSSSCDQNELEMAGIPPLDLQINEPAKAWRELSGSLLGFVTNH
jgi:hypothetical protein